MTVTLYTLRCLANKSYHHDHYNHEAHEACYTKFGSFCGSIAIWSDRSIVPELFGTLNDLFADN